MTTMSGWKRRAASIASATVPASATTWNAFAPVEEGDEALADDLVVVDDEQAETGRGRRVGHAGGLSDCDRDHGPMSRVPCARRDCRSRVGRPRAAARSRRLAEPMMPGPERRLPGRSRRRRRRSRRRSHRRRGRDDDRPGVARAWRAMLLSASRTIWSSSPPAVVDRGRQLVARVVDARLDVDGRRQAQLVGQRREAGGRSAPSTDPGAGPRMKSRMSRDRAVDGIDRADRRAPSPRPALGDESPTSSSDRPTA